ncbi:hypothetical protein P175DRAFT_0434164 [Aspergillus ochraceoroseus IBT 24754]|uniref:Cell wall mannoprotein 1 n=3 Tax=Aspergillus subgen. Nidulantes TaxID=2720870 RepID=A0A0F8U470_9EURO|nr:uncharacterized protein P175DRAFT_0434164 [Aspergillus ochraceoroseus IBT 24754]KKK14388.1 hypothetical protein ARAM_000101 [Aspergillus rambellii]KKK25593.1 hypothetical protein AOCH_000086 [Aspergillus ochraceoroseus]PTU21588.1 hypothetical protein P175DRAFT_0434164 [Aspergillus ochraceoroseus IBT 24754]
MKFMTTLVTVSLAFGAFAEPIAQKKRALADYQAVFQDISDQVTVIQTDVASYVAGSIAGTVVQDDSSTLVDVINNGTTTISGLDSLSNLDALGLVSPIQNLTSGVSDLVDAVIAAKPNFDADGLSAATLTSLQTQKNASEGLRDTITPKVPSALSSIAADLANGIVSEIQRGIDAYS